jgi:type VII secretion integral membrane protein EccD
LSVTDPGLCRVSVHAGTAVVDLALPSGMPVAALMPPVVDILQAHGVSLPIATRYRLSIPGSRPLDSSMTLAQNGIRDGDALYLSVSAAEPPALRYDDVAEGVSEALDGRTWSRSQERRARRLTAALTAGFVTGIGGLALIRSTFSPDPDLTITAGIVALGAFAALVLAAVANRAYRDAMAGLTLSLVATAFSAVAGFLAVSGPPSLPRMLLATAAAAAMAVLALRLSGCGTVSLTAIACYAMVVALAAFGGVLTGTSLHRIGAVMALASLGLLGMAARAAIIAAGLSPKPDAVATDVTASAVRADAWLASLQAAFSSSAATGAILVVVAGTPRSGCIAFAATTAALLLLRAGSIDKKGTLAGAIAAILTAATTFAHVVLTGQHGPRIAATTGLLVGAAVYLGFVAPRVLLPPVARKSVEVLEYMALIAMVPLTCWICGLYGAARSLHSPWG